jgi:hypothetical protein
MSLTLSERTTNYTQTSDQVIRSAEPNGREYLSRYNYHSKRITNTSELDYIIHYLVVDQGFRMESERNGEIFFSHSHNDSYNYTHYHYYPRESMMDKVTVRFLDYV